MILTPPVCACIREILGALVELFDVAAAAGNPGEGRSGALAIEVSSDGVLVSSDVALFDDAGLVSFFELRGRSHAGQLTLFDWLFTLTDAPHVCCGEIAFKLDIPAHGMLGHTSPEAVGAKPASPARTISSNRVLVLRMTRACQRAGGSKDSPRLPRAP
jgi:hypothetical protein